MTAEHEATADFPPTLREVMLRPWWLGMLGVALLVAAIFAWLGQWQLGRAIDTDPMPPGASEQILPIAEVTSPGEYLPGPFVGQRTEVTGRWIAEDFLVVSSRFNGGEPGYWVTGQFRVDPASLPGVDGPTSLAVALGWTSSREDADAAAAALAAAPPVGGTAGANDAGGALTLTGRLISDEGVRPPGRGQPITEMVTMSPAALLGWWHDTEQLNVFRPYLVADHDTVGAVPASLLAIDSPAPDEGSAVNWLNIFYAVEWAVFAGFAFYMWYRLARDAWERDVEEHEDAAAAAAGSAPPPGD